MCGDGVRPWVRWAASACSVLICAGGVSARAQVQYAKGQNVAPVFEGWERAPDGGYSLVFGYLNRNYEEEVNIPIGPENQIDIGGDQGQPTHFYPRRQRFVFRVVVPRDWDKKRKVIWTLTSSGRTDQAKGWLQPEWELSEGVIVENMGGGVPDPNNKPPTLTIGPVPPVTLPNAAVLAASATDDGLPKPYRRSPSNPDRDSQPRRPGGVQIKWIQYRGPGAVIFAPDVSPIVHGEPVALTARATFSAPGTYVLRATANDGQLYTTRDVTVIVSPTSSVKSVR
jgi:hypothetical protein